MRRERTRAVAWWSLVALWMTVIFSFSAQSGGTSSGLSDAVVHVLQRMTGQQVTDVGVQTFTFVVRKSAHATEYLLLGVLLACAWPASFRRRLGRRWQGRQRRLIDFLRRQGRWLGPFVIAVAYAASDETHQLWVPGRSGQVRDVLIDSAGAAVGVLIASLVLRRRGRNQGRIAA